ncbi:hypothetical protein FDF74_09410 [Clostridium niameyense]|uniref:Ribose-5-phosphate isomerase n=1 Tax=Clostridium niameyense TaxID=1622073 RepID=A0A6M0RCI0_9CLOT|nr:hypothetical protein [Clostridium niameyense]
MSYFDNSNDKYSNIIKLLCKYKGISDEDLIKIMKDEDCRYLLFLLIRKYNCINMKRLSKDFKIESYNHLCDNLERAEEMLLLDRKIRDMFFEAGDIIDNTK